MVAVSGDEPVLDRAGRVREPAHAETAVGGHVAAGGKERASMEG